MEIKIQHTYQQSAPVLLFSVEIVKKKKKKVYLDSFISSLESGSFIERGKILTFFKKKEKNQSY